jgi:hypothetical protein
MSRMESEEANVDTDDSIVIELRVISGDVGGVVNLRWSIFVCFKLLNIVGMYEGRVTVVMFSQLMLWGEFFKWMEAAVGWALTLN